MKRDSQATLWEAPHLHSRWPVQQCSTQPLPGHCSPGPCATRPHYAQMKVWFIWQVHWGTPNTSYHLAISVTLDQLTPLEPASNPSTHMEELPQLAEKTATPWCGPPVTSKFPAQRRTHAHNYAGKPQHDLPTGYSHIGWTGLFKTRGLLHRHRNYHWHFNKEVHKSSWGQNMQPSIHSFVGPLKQANLETQGSAITIICLIRLQVQCHFSALPHTKVIPILLQTLSPIPTLWE